ncbi:MAG: PBP1A family penicillin-binding protein [Chlorobi bacterium]|nr:PBP1A family penicillin-binding protein [Chlorobiota bacterium]
MAGKTTQTPTGKRKSAKRPAARKRTVSKQKQPHKKRKYFIWGLKLFAGGLSAMAVFVLFVYLGLFGALPSYQELSRIKQNSASEIYSADGKLMGRYYIQNRITIDNEDVSDYVKKALIATEDSRFFEHKGVDVISIGRVIVKSIILGDRSQGGGSTISQQLAKNLYPRKNLGFLTLPVGKTKEIFIASRLEKIYTKEEILTLYLNTVPFGENIYGIETAARRFFSKHSKDLNPAEAATLVGMLAANTRYNPHRNPELSIKRRNIVLDRMAAQKYISQAQAEKYKSMPLNLRYKRVDGSNAIAPYFRAYIRKHIEEILDSDYGNKYNLYTDGLKITTTINSTLQKYAEYAVHTRMKRLQQEFNRHWKNKEPWGKYPDIYINALKRSDRYKKLKSSGKRDAEIMKIMEHNVSMKVFTYDGYKSVTMSPADSVRYYLKLLNAGFLALNPENGYILAWVGGIDYSISQIDHVLTRRQVGSTFKPIVYTAAMMEGMEPDTYISNERRTYRKYNNWSPANHDGKYSGFYSLKGGLVNSVNTISAEVIVRTGIDEVIDLAEETGITSPIPEVPSIALGTAEISLLEMVTAYATFPNYGKPVKPVEILKIEDRNGNILWKNKTVQDNDNIYDNRVAYSIINMMQGVVDRGTARGLRSTFGLRSDLAGKTGTTQDNSDGWFIGYTPSLVAGAWVGNDIPAIHFRSTVLGQGAHTALPVFARFMQKTENDSRFSSYTSTTFYQPPEDLAMQLSVPEFSEEDPDLDLFERIFRKFNKSDPTETKRREQENEKRDTKSILQRMKELFRKK